MPSHGDVELKANGTFLYMPGDGYVGSDYFTYRATDRHGVSSNVTTVQITVQGANDVPTAGPVTVSATEDGPQKSANPAAASTAAAQSLAAGRVIT